MKYYLCILLYLGSSSLVAVTNRQDLWKPAIADADLKIEPKTSETAYQYAERKVNEMRSKYPNRRIDGTYWLSDYWRHHYYGALQWRNYYWVYN